MSQPVRLNHRAASGAKTGPFWAEHLKAGAGIPSLSFPAVQAGNTPARAKQLGVQVSAWRGRPTLGVRWELTLVGSHTENSRSPLALCAYPDLTNAEVVFQTVTGLPDVAPAGAMQRRCQAGTMGLRGTGDPRQRGAAGLVTGPVTATTPPTGRTPSSERSAPSSARPAVQPAAMSVGVRAVR